MKPFRLAAALFLLTTTLIALPASSQAAGEGPFDTPATPFLKRHRPLPMALELGLHGGMQWFSSDHNIIQSGRAHQELASSPEVGLRLGFYPLTFLGAEVEGAFIPSSTTGDDQSARIAALRGHAVLQLPIARVVPFALVGGGMLALTGGSMGKDTDPSFHVGAGVKFAVTENFTVRLDARDTILQKNRLIAGVEDGDLVHNMSVLLGVAFTLGRTELAEGADGDGDGDGVPDSQDKCPTTAGTSPDGCAVAASAPGDRDGDGVADNDDKCPDAAEDGASDAPTDGCPNPDADSDGILAAADQCPDVAGVAPDGCPPKDTDGDGVKDDADKCLSEPETANGFQDEDGCPDELPKEVAKYTGAIKGITFESGKSTIRKQSKPVLDDVSKILAQYPTLRIRITGHTDSRGSADANRKLSQERADALKAYLVSKGTDEGRIEARGAGPDSPVADNKTAAGRAANRRIEFELLH